MSRWAAATLLGLVATALAGCDVSLLSPSERRALAAAEARWAARGFQDYSFEVLHQCFCPPEITQWVRVAVVGGQVGSIVFVDSTADMPTVLRSQFRTVEQTFTDIRTSSHSDGLEDLIVEFDGQLGYPTRVTFASKPDYVDAGLILRLRNAGPLP